MTKIKICGLTRPADIDAVNCYKPDYAGFVFAPSKRQVDALQAKSLIQNLDNSIKPVGVFVNADTAFILQTAQTAQLAVVQLHGDETVEEINALQKNLPSNIHIWKALRIKDAESCKNANNFKTDKLLLDAFSETAYGGTGKVANWETICNYFTDKNFFLAGGLTLQNIEQALDTVNPYGVDLSSGVETNGKKDAKKIKSMIYKIRKRAAI